MTCKVFIKDIDTSAMSFDGSNSAKESEFSADGTIFDEDVEEMDAEYIERMIRESGSSIVIFDLDLDNSDEEFLEFMTEWISYHDKLSQLSEKYGDDWLWEHEPFKEFGMSYVGSDSKEHVCTLTNVMYMNRMSDGKLVLFVSEFKGDKISEENGKEEVNG